MRTSLFDLFKIGIGPSSSHTVGPMRAAYAVSGGLPAEVSRVRVDLYGSLALTGRGHATPRGIALGLAGYRPDTADATSDLRFDGFAFDVDRDVVFHPDQVLPGHSNGMRFTALDDTDRVLQSRVFYSTGGGFVVEEGAPGTGENLAAVPYPFQSGADLLELGAMHGLRIHEIMFANERAWRGENEIRAGIRRLWEVMQECTRRGLETEGVLPGGLNVQRRAPARLRKLTASRSNDPLNSMDWLNVFAMAVNEENAAGGRVVTAPTNGAAGIIPAVAHYYMRFMQGGDAGLERYFLSAAAIGVLYKENASISGAEVGCQGEVGVACSMAAAGLAAALDGENEQVEHAAEIGMEHNLGMTCDPIGGLVQIPCIERNAFGAVKAVNATRMALEDTGSHKVSLDQVIRTMYQTGMDMQSRYKETSLAGLAVNVIEC
jgi:L-serine dehydratase